MDFDAEIDYILNNLKPEEIENIESKEFEKAKRNYSSFLVNKKETIKPVLKEKPDKKVSKKDDLDEVIDLFC